MQLRTSAQIPGVYLPKLNDLSVQYNTNYNTALLRYVPACFGQNHKHYTKQNKN